MNLLHLELPLVPRVEHSPGENLKTKPRALSNRAAITQRLQEVNDEWPLERILETTAAAACVITFAPGFVIDERWLVLPLIVSVFLLQQALLGWCLLSPLLRHLGFRTEREIQLERHALEQMEEAHAACHCPGPVMEKAGVQADTAPPASCPVCASSFSLREFCSARCSRHNRREHF